LKDLIRLLNISTSLHIKFVAVAHLAEGQFLHATEKKDDVFNIARQNAEAYYQLIMEG
jgi:hypothetical protein